MGTAQLESSAVGMSSGNSSAASGVPLAVAHYEVHPGATRATPGAGRCCASHCFDNEAIKLVINRGQQFIHTN